MRPLKLVLLVVLTVLIMRLISWAIAWILSRRFKMLRRGLAVYPNLFGMLIFTGCLFFQMGIEEPSDMLPVFFGAVVYGAFALVDHYWFPWKQEDPPEN